MENIKKIISWPVILGIQVITTVLLLFFIFKLNILPTTYAVMVGMIFVLLGFINYALMKPNKKEHHHKTKPREIVGKVISLLLSVLKAISGCFETNMASSDITDLIKMQINDNASWTFKQKQFTGTGVMQTGGAYMPDSKLYYMIPNDDSVKENLQAIKDVLNGK